jgi:hypothetical protein
VRTGGVEPPQRGAAALQAVELADAQRPHQGARAALVRPSALTGRHDRRRTRTHARGSRPDSNRYCEVHDLGCCRYTTATMDGDDGTRTRDRSPDKRQLLPLSYVPEWRGWDSNPRSRAHEARGDSRSPTARVWPAGVEPAISGSRHRRGGPLPHSQMQRNPRRDSNPRFRVESPASSPSRPRGHESSEALESNQALLVISEPCRRGHLPPRLRRQDSNLPFASNSRASYRLDHTGTKGGGSRDRTCGRRRAAYALATRCLTTRPYLRERKERESNPQGREAHPFSRRDTAPMAVLPDGPGRDSNPHRTD